jgi:hypothetical protein
MVEMSAGPTNGERTFPVWSGAFLTVKVGFGTKRFWRNRSRTDGAMAVATEWLLLEDCEI